MNLRKRAPRISAVVRAESRELLQQLEAELAARGIERSKMMAELGFSKSTLNHWCDGGSMKPATMKLVRGWIAERPHDQFFPQRTLSTVLREARHLVGAEFDKKNAAIARRLIDLVAMLAPKRIDLSEKEVESAEREQAPTPVGADEGHEGEAPRLPDRRSA